MPVTTICSKCQKKYAFPNEALGKRIRCPHCQEIHIAVHTAAAPPIVAPSPAALPAIRPPLPSARPPAAQPVASPSAVAKRAVVPPPVAQPSIPPTVTQSPLVRPPAALPVLAPSPAQRPVVPHIATRTLAALGILNSHAAVLRDRIRSAWINSASFPWLRWGGLAAVSLIVTFGILTLAWSFRGNAANSETGGRPPTQPAGVPVAAAKIAEQKVATTPVSPTPGSGPPLNGKAPPPVPTIVDEEPEPIAEREGMPPVLVRLRSLNSLIDAVKTLADTVEQGPIVDLMLLSLKAQFGQDGLPGVDAQKPWGAYIQIASNLNRPQIVALVPVSNEKLFIELLRTLQVEVQQQNEAFLLQHPALAQGFALRFAQGYAWVALDEATALDASNLVMPANLLAEPSKLLSAALRFDAVPDNLREQLITQIEVQTANLKPMLPAADKSQQESGEKLLDVLVNGTAALLREGKEFSLYLDVDSRSKQFAAELRFSGARGSSLAGSIASVGNAPSLFAAYSRLDAPLCLQATFRLPEQLRSYLASAARDATRAVLKDANDDRDEAERLFALLEPNVAAGDVDLGIAFQDHGNGRAGTVIGGIKVVNGRELEKWLKYMVATQLPAPEKALFQFDIEQFGDAGFHRLNPHAHFPDWLSQGLGQNPNYLAFRNNAICWSGGLDGMAGLRNTLLSPPGVAPMFDMKINTRRLIELIRPSDTAAAARVFTDANPGRVRIRLSGGEALRLQASLDLALLRFAKELIPFELKSAAVVP